MTQFSPRVSFPGAFARLAMVNRILFSLLAAIVAAAAVSAPLHAEEKQRIAVLDLAQHEAQEEAEAIAEELRRAFVKSGKYVVVDRTLTDQILKEWETQQSGLTEGEKAVKIGKLFNVQLIVSGKLNRFSSGGWQVSVVMLDAQTGIAKKAETVRHRGDFFSLLDEKVPRVAAVMVGMEMPERPAGPPRLKLAVFPPHFEGAWKDKLAAQHSRWGGRWLGKVLKRHRRFVRPLFSYIPAGANVDSRRLKSEYPDLGQDAWSGSGGTEPNDPYIFRKGKELGVELVLLFKIRGERGRMTYNAYLLDIGRRKRFEKEGTWRKKRLGKDLAAGIKNLLKHYKNSR